MWNLWRYFDLNKRALKSQTKSAELSSEIVQAVASASALATVGTVFAPKISEEMETKKEIKDRLEEIEKILKEQIRPYHISPVHQIFLYLGLFIGVLFSEAVNQFAKGGNLSIVVTTIRIVGSLLITFMLIPTVYEKLGVNPKAPFFVQFAIFFQNGVFWHVIINSMGKFV